MTNYRIALVDAEDGLYTTGGSVFIEMLVARSVEGKFADVMTMRVDFPDDERSSILGVTKNHADEQPSCLLHLAMRLWLEVCRLQEAGEVEGYSMVFDEPNHEIYVTLPNA